VVPHFVVLGTVAAIERQIRKFAEERPNLPFDIDGIVFKILERSRRKKLGSTSRAPRWATAYKFPAEQRRRAAQGRSSSRPAAPGPDSGGILEPVFVGGVTVSNVTLHNEDEIERLGLVPATPWSCSVPAT
jgi:DNA ligase (NAD+)